MYLLQLFTLLFAVTFAWYSKIPVTKMINNGASLSEEKEFHNASAACRVLFVVTVSAVTAGTFWAFLFYLCLLGLVQWFAFDIALNIALNLPGKPWHYIGTTARLDRLLREVYDEDAGKWKAAIVGAVLLFINIIHAL
jgi:hypothetical protein